MDEIDQVVDNLFSQYIKPGTGVTAGTPKVSVPKGEQPPAVPSPAEQSIDDLIMEVSPSSAPQSAASEQPATESTPARKKVTKPVTSRTVSKKKTRTRANKGIKEIKMETAKMLRYLSTAIKSDNWWHKLYYSHKFVRKSMYIAQVITKRQK